MEVYIGCGSVASNRYECAPHILATSAPAHVYICLFHFKFEDAFVYCAQSESERDRDREAKVVRERESHCWWASQQLRTHSNANKWTGFRTNAHNQSRNEYNELPSLFSLSSAFLGLAARIFKSASTPFLHVKRESFVWCEASSFMPGARVRSWMSAILPMRRLRYLLKLMFSTSCINVRQSMSGFCCCRFHCRTIYWWIPVSALCTIYALDNAILLPDTTEKKEKPGPAGTFRGKTTEIDEASLYLVCNCASILL